MSKQLNTLEFRLYSGFFRPIFVPVVFTTNDQLKLVKMASGSGRPRAVPSKIPFFGLNGLKNQLLASKLAFQTLVRAPRRKAIGNGSIANVEADVVNPISPLHRLPVNTATIKIY